MEYCDEVFEERVSQLALTGLSVAAIDVFAATSALADAKPEFKDQWRAAWTDHRVSATTTCQTSLLWLKYSPR